jgi:hypothetical protein
MQTATINRQHLPKVSEELQKANPPKVVERPSVRKPPKPAVMDGRVCKIIKIHYPKKR